MATHLNTGDTAPDFTGKDENGNSISLNDYKGRKVVLYFYPQDDTPTCTLQACNLRDHYTSLQKEGFIILGISPDDAASHKKFKAKYKLPFSLIADPQHNIIDKYGVWGEKNMYGRKYMGLLRTTFIINKEGIIERIIKKPKSKMHASELMNNL